VVELYLNYGLQMACKSNNDMAEVLSWNLYAGTSPGGDWKGTSNEQHVRSIVAQGNLLNRIAMNGEKIMIW
jgi:hypothetical protein